jgi:hypothetical protein
MANRKSLLVGSLPFKNEKEAMELAVESLSDSLISLPDGEIGEKTEQYPEGSRTAWAMNVIDMCIADSTNWDIVQEGKLLPNGFPVDYDTLYKLRPKHSPEEIAKYLNFGYFDTYMKSYHLYQELRKEKNLQNVPFQVGVPTGMAMSLHMLEPENIFRYFDAFNERLAYEMNQIIDYTNNDIVIQIECPAEIGLVYANPPQVEFAISSILGLVNRLNNSVKIGIHFCYGDLNNKALVRPETLERMADFANEFISQWPKNKELSYIHFPLAEGNEGPRLNSDYYKPLGKIQLPKHTRFVAGFVHEKRNADELKQILDHIESIRKHEVDVACSCGMGRRKTEVGLQLMTLMKQLVEA